MVMDIRTDGYTYRTWANQNWNTLLRYQYSSSNCHWPTSRIFGMDVEVEKTVEDCGFTVLLTEVLAKRLAPWSWSGGGADRQGSWRSFALPERFDSLQASTFHDTDTFWQYDKIFWFTQFDTRPLYIVSLQPQPCRCQICQSMSLWTTPTPIPNG